MRLNFFFRTNLLFLQKFLYHEEKYPFYFIVNFFVK